MTGADLIFYVDEHEYWTPPGKDQGRHVPNVTTILQATGVSVDFELLHERRPAVLEFRRQLGSAVHTDCHAFDDDDLATSDERVAPFVDAWATLRVNFHAQPMHRERRVYHAELDVCGTLDGIFELHDEGRVKRVLIDLKIGNPEDAGAHQQTAFYEAAYLSENPGERIDERWAVQLCPDRPVAYRITNYTRRPEGWRDFQKFRATVSTYHEQAVRRRRIT